jgi:hypothetical protein
MFHMICLHEYMKEYFHALESLCMVCNMVVFILYEYLDLDISIQNNQVVINLIKLKHVACDDDAHG